MSASMTDEMEVKLLPCPFCGAAAEWNKGQHGDGSPWEYLACSDCEAMGPWQKNDPSNPNLTRAEAIAAWNRRALRPAGEPEEWREPASSASPRATFPPR